MTINNNSISVRDLTLSAEGIIKEQVICKDIRFVYEKDENGKWSSEPVAVRYSCINPETFDTFSVKVPGSIPVTDIDDFKKSGAFIILEVPVKDTLIKPYRIEYGKALVSITAPFVKLAKN